MIDQLKEKLTGIVANKLPALSKQEYRDFIDAFGIQLGDLPGAVTGNVPGTLKHTFAGGMYIRQITMPANTVWCTKVHKYESPYFIMSGDVSVISDEGVMRIKAPYQGVTKEFTKRILVVHEETVWTTVHVTSKKEVEEVERELTVGLFSEIEQEKGEEICHSHIPQSVGQ